MASPVSSILCSVGTTVGSNVTSGRRRGEGILNQSSTTSRSSKRKVLTPNDVISLKQLEQRIAAFAQRYFSLHKPFGWTFARHELEQRLRDPSLDVDPMPLSLAA